MDVTNWLDNLTFLKRRAYAQFPGVMVHQGFYWAYRSVAPQVLNSLQTLRKKHPQASVMVAGHSLGGAVAAICAFELEYIEKIPVHSLYTFGKPRVGNTNFSGRLRNASMEVYRVTHFQDAVPHLPPTWTGFEHTSEEPRVGNTNFSGRLRNASMEVYRVTHFQDAVPHLPPTWTGFEHTSEEIFYDEFSASYRNCSQTDGEDPTCSNICSPFSCTSIVDHLTYLNITMSHLIC
ncbi:Lipase [Phytophthora megakarya]|uniref:Lipase n=1 Tax=Phytophthora megakarya TaxID=4795 RepID=A0A225VJZ4_9STRA|nr:Lipase [Phytophthora megakarya]